MDYKLVVPLALFANGWDFIRSIFGYYSWQPKERLTNYATKDINSYPNDLKLKDGDLCFENGDFALVSKEEAFAQHLQMFMSVMIGEWKLDPEYGCEFVESIFKANSKEFKRQCEHLAKAIIQHQTYKDYIEEIYVIRRKRSPFLYGNITLYIEFKLKGRPDTFTVKLSNVTDLVNKRQKNKAKK